MVDWNHNHSPRAARHDRPALIPAKNRIPETPWHFDEAGNRRYDMRIETSPVLLSISYLMTNEYRRFEHTPIPGIRIFAQRQAQAGRACGGLLTSGAMVPRAIALAVSPKRPIDSGVIHDPANAEMPFSLQGQLLIASPTLADGTFDHSVIYLHQHSSTT